MAVTEFLTTGLKIGTLAEYIEHIEERYKASDIYGETVRTGEGSVVGWHARHKAELLSDIAALLAYAVAQQNPDDAEGVFLDSLVLFNGIERNQKVYSTVTLQCTSGPAGTTIPAGRQVSDGAGAIFATDSELVIGPSTEAYISATAIEEGPIEAAVGVLTTIEQPVYGWMAVTNLTEANVGHYAESDPALKLRRRLAARGIGGGSAAYIEKRLRNVDEVTDVSVEFTPEKVLRVVVEGGDDDDIAATLYRSVAGGTVYEGTEEIEYTDPDVDQTGTIRFYRAIEIPIYVDVVLEKLSGYEGAGGDALIKQRIKEYFDGTLEIEGENVPRPRLGEDITPSKVSLGADTVDRCIVRSVLLGQEEFGSRLAEDISIDFNQRGTTALENIVIR